MGRKLLNADLTISNQNSKTSLGAVLTPESCVLQLIFVRREPSMKHRILELVFINAVFLTISASICAQSQSRILSQSKLTYLAYVDTSALQLASSDAISTITSKTRNTRGGKIFIFHTDEFWLNLHHFLYVLGRAENKETNAKREAVAAAPGDQEHGLEKLSANEQKIWREAVASYAAGISKKDIVFDD